jgi:tetratricopeptide (TPR) repeat protein
MGNICCEFFNSFSKTPPNSLPCLVLYKKDDLSTTNSSQFTQPEKSTDTDIVEFILSPCEIIRQKSSDKLSQYPKSPIIENYIVIWLSSNPNEDQDTLNELHHLFNSFRLFTNVDEFFAFIVTIKTEKLFLILSDISAENIISVIHKMSQLIGIYIISTDQSNNNQWINQYEKIQGIFNHIKPICDNLKRIIYLSENDILPIEIVNSSSIIIQYLIKQILLFDINYNDKSKKDFIDFSRKNYRNELNIINEFEENYTFSTAIWWYTRKCFIYSAINKAFRTENIEHLIKMGFFIRDLDQNIDRLNSDTMIVYRGQGILENELELLKMNKNSFFSFKNFLWTNTDRTISLSYARLARNNPDLFGVLFRIEIHSMIKLISLENLSYYLNSKNENLFSIYSLFHINDIKQIEDKIWEINLILINNDDQQLKDYLQTINDIEGETFWQQLGFYFMEINQFDKAEELYKILIESNLINDSKQLALLNEQLAILYHKKNDFINSIFYYKKSLKDYLNIFSQNDSNLFIIYLNIGKLLHQQNQFNEAIKHYKYALNISLHSSTLDHLQISNLYHYIADIYDEQGIFVDAIQNYQSALENELNHIPLRHLSIAKTYNKIGEIFYRMEDYTTAFSYFDKTLQIQKKSLSPNHSILATTNYNIAMALDGLQQHKEAIEYASRAVNIARHAFGSNHKGVQLYEEYLDELRQKTLIGVIPNGSVYE